MIKDKEERFNALTHFIGIPFSIGIIIWATRFSLFSFFLIALFGLSLLATYLISTLYHLEEDLYQKQSLRLKDHISIYYLIAGTNTCLIMELFDEIPGWIYLSILWFLVIAASLYKVYWYNKYPRISVPIYLFLGWMAVFILFPLWNRVAEDVLFWIVAGGLSYTIGVIFYNWTKLPYHHGIWHLFVIAGSIGHFLAIRAAYLN